MPTITPEIKANLTATAERQGFSESTVTDLYLALVRGNGTMAQFSSPEVGGAGQWMRGGMLMVGDMFNNNLKNRVGALFNDLVTIYEQRPIAEVATFVPHSANAEVDPDAKTSEGIPLAWGQPSSSGSQNDTRYAYYPQARRLLVARNDESWVYDTGDHQIGGVQQQNDWGAMTFTSQYGTVNLNSLPVVMKDGKPL
ncbi:MAG: SHOCT domain-containing protein [Thiofilum sp.]|uniref:SHOCT domain-containing protein n=1 Tax=Thiofilum sp. TaxID=2212733 RepID=UPI0025F678C0|nr:SHOCT domain-containing protein [Thiofilum sp.]MBK8454675.1 SHOCT domain-containing protein [Thiofilum sp.]